MLYERPNEFKKIIINGQYNINFFYMLWTIQVDPENNDDNYVSLIYKYPMFHMKGTKQNGVGPITNGKISGLSGMAKGTMMLCLSHTYYFNVP